ncbi:flagellar hook-basal body complex protein [Candidatus Odyssella thessalonicensis]|uniref:flagellar hook-basal body complex protein n=1 Tax=Candidatus Odyssella thessalonicensis TaxID=84647 RepID=UPI000225BC63|nr:flagellar hook-basal body complex protein [Candidatus Odyssella thessalonicensis]
MFKKSCIDLGIISLFFLTQLIAMEKEGNFNDQPVKLADIIVSNQTCGERIDSDFSTHMAIDGDGFFITSSAPEDNENLLFTRVGTFVPDKNGNFVNHEGQFLKGFPIDASGTLTEKALELSNLQTLSLTNFEAQAAKATTAIFIDDTTLPYKSYLNSEYVESFKINDEQGYAYGLNLVWQKVAVKPETWTLKVQSPENNQTFTIEEPYHSGIPLSFNKWGYLTTINGKPIDFHINNVPPLTIIWKNSEAVSNITINLGGREVNRGVRAWGDKFMATAVRANGNMGGYLLKCVIDKYGSLVGVYDNGHCQAFARVALANFPAPHKLKKIRWGLYCESEDSGSCQLSLPGSRGSRINPNVIDPLSFNNDWDGHRKFAWENKRAD